MARLIVMMKKNSVKLVDLKGPVTRIGRDLTSDVQIEQPQISRHHAEVVLEDGNASVRDMGSVNGTYVNGQKVTAQELHHGDVLRFGDCDMRFLSQGTAKPAQSLSLA
ncbi:MAG: FHA domain-containing protein [Variovorax sp.]